MDHSTRYCPRCTYPMTEVQAGGTTVDHCHRCGGTAVESHAIEENVGKWAQPEHWLQTLGHMTTGERLQCPVDHGWMTGFQVPFDGKSVVVDHCASCGTLWLDRGEGKKLVDIVYAARAASQRRSTPGTTQHDAELERRQDTEEPDGVRSYLFQLFTGLPVEVWNPVRGSTPVTITMLVLIVAVFAVQAYFAVANSATSQAIANGLGLVPAEFLRRPWGIVTYALLHGGLFHLLGNAYFLQVFGDNVEDRLGISKYLLLYFGASVAGGLLHLAIYPHSTTPVVGASGAIAGLMGAYLMLFPRVKLWVIWFFVRWRMPVIMYLGLWIGMQLLLPLLHVEGVAWTAHVGGFAVGLLAGWVWKDSPHPLEGAEFKAGRLR